MRDETGLKHARRRRNTVETEAALRPELPAAPGNFRMQSNDEQTLRLSMPRMSQ
jgi:hypothetical protein